MLTQIRLVYIGRLVLGDDTSPRLWNVIRPALPGYSSYSTTGGYPTLSLSGLIEKGLLRARS